MTKGAALQAFFSQFLTAYPSTAVPDDVAYPYLTYTPIFANFGDSPMNLTVNLWFYTDSESVPNAKVDQISDAIGYGGTLLSCDDGAIWLKRGEPWCQPMTDGVSPNVKRRYINVSAEYLTT